MRTERTGETLIYISYGMTKCGSTLAFQLARTILEQNDYPQTRLSDAVVPAGKLINFVTKLHLPQLEAVEQEARALGYPVVLKTHSGPTEEVKAWAAQGRIIGHCVYRDLREMALSMVEHGVRSRAQGRPAFSDIEDLDSALKSIHRQCLHFSEWVRLPGFIPLYYDDVAFDTQATIRRLCQQMGLNADPATVERIVKTERGTQFNKGVPGRFRELAPEDSERILREFNSFYENFINPHSQPPQAPNEPSAGEPGRPAGGEPPDPPQRLLRRLGRMLRWA
jgi:hypothetical protein